MQFNSISKLNILFTIMFIDIILPINKFNIISLFVNLITKILF